MVTFFALLSRVRDILVAVVMGVTGSLVLKVFFVVVHQHVLMSGWLSVALLAGVLSQEFVDQVSFLVFIDVHVGHWRNFFSFFFSASCPSPMSLHSLHVPLVDNSDDSLSTAFFVQISENTFISQIY